MNALLTLEELRREQNTLRLLHFGLIGLLVAAIAVALAHNTAGVFFAFAVVIGYYLFLHRKRREYERALTAVNLSRVFAGLEGLTLKERGGTGITAEEVRAARLVPLNDGSGAVAFFLGLSGRTEGMEVSLNDAALHHGKAVHCGCWMRFVLPEPLRADFRVQGDRAEEGTPPGAFMEKLRELVAYTPGEFFMGVKGCVVDAYIKHRVLARPFSVNVPPNQELLDFDPMPEFKKVQGLVALLR